jgi:hypothetical protein
MRTPSFHAVTLRTAAIALAATVSSIALVRSPAGHAQTGPEKPVATYWATATTNSGITAGGPGAMLSAKGGAQRELQLQLESSRTTTGEPAAEHLPPAGLKVGLACRCTRRGLLQAPETSVPAASKAAAPRAGC